MTTNCLLECILVIHVAVQLFDFAIYALRKQTLKLVVILLRRSKGT